MRIDEKLSKYFFLRSQLLSRLLHGELTGTYIDVLVL